METSAGGPLLIVGGGIGGCAAALALARRGFEVTVLEQSAELKEIGAGIQLGPNAFRVFDALDLREAIERVVVYPDGLVMMDALSGEEVTRIGLGQPFLERFKQPYGVIYRADLHQVLVDACRAEPAIRLLTGQKLVDFEDDGRRVRVTTEAGATHVGAALIGADGLWSRIREKVVGDGKPHVSGHIAYRAVLPAAEVPSHLRFNDMTLWAGPKLHLVQYPLRRGELFNLVAVFHSDRYEEGWDTYGDPAELHQRFSAACEPVQQLLSKIETWRMWVLCDREPVSDWSQGRVTLLGDAAHPMLQYMAQGACMAMEDAMVLAQRADQHRADLAQAFLAYQADRSVRTCRVQLTARLYGAAYHAEGPVRELRNQFLRSRTPEQSRESLAWLYDPI
ncbi:3-hydroxybenzoate 6-monooxygenase [Ramlibacter aurantiacus]